MEAINKLSSKELINTPMAVVQTKGNMKDLDTKSGRTVYYVYGQCEIITPKCTPPIERPAGFQEFDEAEFGEVQMYEITPSIHKNKYNPIKLTDTTLERFYRAFLAGAERVKLEKMFGMKKHTVWGLLHGKSWKGYKSEAKTKALAIVQEKKNLKFTKAHVMASLNESTNKYLQKNKGVCINTRKRKGFLNRSPCLFKP